MTYYEHENMKHFQISFFPVDADVFRWGPSLEPAQIIPYGCSLLIQSGDFIFSFVNSLVSVTINSAGYESSPTNTEIYVPIKLYLQPLKSTF